MTPQVGNLLRRLDGRGVVCDFDSTSLGPSGVDLAAAAAEIWFEFTGKRERLATAYGLDITTAPPGPGCAGLAGSRSCYLTDNPLGRTKPYSFICAPRLLVTCKMEGA
jgi:hypothetical protein